MSAVWNSVTVYGPAEAIMSFRSLCLSPDNPTLTSHQFGWDGCTCEIAIPSISSTAFKRSEVVATVDNFQHFHSDLPTRYQFSFDTFNWFPESVFKRLAGRFKDLVFDCDCIGAMDENMGYGFFNTPPGGKGFSQHYRVPKNYWTTGPGFKRTRSAQAKYEACLRYLISSLAAESVSG